MSGETGAGKSILLGALQLALGQRADNQSLKNQDQKCIVELEVQLDASWQPWFDQEEIDYSPLTWIRREVIPGGKSRAFLNDTPVRLDQLSDFSHRLLDIHSQQDTLFLTDSDFLLDLIDDLGSYSQAIDQMKESISSWKMEEEALKVIELATSGGDDIEYLRFLRDELVHVRLKEQEGILLLEEHKLLAHADVIQQAMAESYETLEGEEGAARKLTETLRILDRVSDALPSVKDWSERLRGALEELRDISVDTERLASKTEANPQRLEEIEQRLSVLDALKSKHKVTTVEELIPLRDSLMARVEGMENASSAIALATEKRDKAKADAQKQADILHAHREALIPLLEMEVVEALKTLQMPQAQFVMSINKTDRLTSFGSSAVKLLFSSNKGHALLDVSKAASGGERGRLMLALKGLFARGKGLKTVIFDEIDTGISGQTAARVAQIFREMSRHLQVIVITHLPQVAAAGDAHFLVTKSEINGKTQTELIPLSPSDRILEVARMLSGDSLTPAALENAKVLLSSANN